MLNVGLTVDAAGTIEEFKILLNILKDFRIESTFFIGVNLKPNLIRSIYGSGHEIGNHTYTHPTSIFKLTFEEKELEIKSANFCLLDILNEKFKEVEIKGFRAPYFYFDLDVVKVLEKMGYLWDSSKGYFPILEHYFKTENYGNIIELPSLFPDDDTLINKNCLSEKQVLKLWKKSYDMSKDTFIWGIHPYVSVKNNDRIEMLTNFIEYVIEKDGNFLCLSKIARAIPR